MQESGAGKSEAALALIERGHSLVSDDLVKVKLLSDHTQSDSVILLGDLWNVGESA